MAALAPSWSADSQAPAAKNLAPNPSFETGDKGTAADWRFWAYAPEGVARTAAGSWDQTVARTGVASLKITNGGPRDVGTWCNRTPSGFISVTPGNVYTVSVHMKVASVDAAVSTNFRMGFCTIAADGKVTYFPAETRRQIDPSQGRFTEAGVWKRLAVAGRAPEGATHLGMDVDLIGQGTAWLDDVSVTEGYDLAAFGGKLPPVELAIVKDPDKDPTSAEAPVAITFRVASPLTARDLTLECEVVDYWFRPSVMRQTLALKADETREVAVEFDAPTRARLFKMRQEAGANEYKVLATLKSGEEKVAAVTRVYRFANRVRKYEPLPALPATTERIDDIFGAQKLVDVIHCADPQDSHPYMEGGRGMDAKSTGAVPQEDWKSLFREREPAFTTIETVLGQRCRVTHGWGWFGYKLNRQGLKPGSAYLVVMEYPEDVGRTYTIFNTGIVLSLVGGYGFHTGKTLGDHWTRTLNSEYTDYPLSGKMQRWTSLFHLGAQTWAPGDPWNNAPTAGDSKEGFWFIVGGVGPSQDPLAAGAAVSTIKLYEISDMDALFPRIEEPPLELGRRELFMTAESDGITKLVGKQELVDQWAQYRLQDARFMGLSGLSPNGRVDLQPLFDANDRGRYGVKVFPRWMIERDVLGKVGVPPEALAKNADGEDIAPPEGAYTLEKMPDLLHPATLEAIKQLITEELAGLADHPGFAGLMLYKHYGGPFPVSFSDYALQLFAKETGTRLQGEGQARRDWLLADRKQQYYNWWWGKKHAFLLALRDHLQALRPDLKLFYFPWHSDDDFPFSCGRLRYSGRPDMDKIYVPGTNILLVPSYTVPPDQWTAEQKKHPALARQYYRESLAPELQGKLTFEDLLYGRVKDMPQFWGAPRSGELPHLRYPDQMDLVAMLTEPGSVYANGVGHNPRLYLEDKGIVYWAPVRYRFTADNPKFLDLFRTGEGSAIAVHMPYNEETSHLNVPSIHGAHGVEHGGPFCMMEEVVAMAHSDPMYIMDSMWEPLKRGFPQVARAFAQAYRALPAAPSVVLKEAIAPADEAVVVRSYDTAYGQYLAVINRAFDLKERQVQLTLKPSVQAVDRVVNLGTGATVAFQSAGEGRIRIGLTLPPMSLTSLRVLDRVPRAAVRDVDFGPGVFSPNGDGNDDTLVVTGRTVEQVGTGQWSVAVRDANDRQVRRFEGTGPEVGFTWDGKTDAGARCADGKYALCFAAAAYPKLVDRREVVLDTAPPAVRPVLQSDTIALSANNTVLRGRMTGLAAGEVLLLRQTGLPDRVVPIMADGSFAAAVEGLNLGDNPLAFLVRDRAGNMGQPLPVHLQFALDWSKPVGFDFGAGPIMAGFSAIRNDTRYSEERGYGFIKYENVWKGDRGVGDDLVRDYCSGKDDREWAVRLPNGKYTVTVVMVDTLFDHFAPDIVFEGKRVAEHRPIKKNEPLRLSLPAEVTDGVLNCEFKNPGSLPYFALNGIIIERR